MKLVIYILICATILNAATSQNCSTPADCYIKAIGTLNRDREEMRVNNDRLLEKSSKIENEIKSNNEAFNNQMKSDMQALRQEIKNNFDQYMEKLNVLVGTISSIGDRLNSEIESKNYSFNGLRWMQIQNIATGKCLTDLGREQSLIVTDCSNGWSSGQQWKIMPHVEGWYSIFSANNNFVDVHAGGNDNGCKIQSYERNLCDAQRFNINSNGKDFMIVRAYTWKTLNVDLSNGVVNLWDVNNGDNQKWRFKALLDF